VHKTEKVAGWPAALECLRVCWKNPDSAYNCGKCPKCLRTMVTLRLVGCLDECAPLFDEPLSLKRVATMSHYDDNSRAFAKEILADPRLAECEPELQVAVKNWLRPPGMFQQFQRSLRDIRVRRTLRTWMAGVGRNG
jgi:hypothetical protein